MTGAVIGNGVGHPTFNDVQLPEDPAAQAPIDLSSALRPGAAWTATPKNPVPAASSSSAARATAPVRLYGQELTVPRPLRPDLHSALRSMSQGLDALAWPSPTPLLEPRSPIRAPEETAALEREVGEDKLAAYGLDDDDRLAALPRGEDLDGSDWHAVYGMDEPAEALDWTELEADADDEPARAMARAQKNEQSRTPFEDALAEELRAALSEPQSNLDAVFDVEPEPEDTRSFDEMEEELEARATQATASATALSLEDLDRMFDEDFARST